ncbi:MAG: glycosyltransferase 87 family protein [Jatrophihabitans sp.]|uniref:glycosyltransferase 87 family protein n=1 Tax=Jatrophihabitans sp. TaxID=1932789 RepID=UPI003F7E7E7B
MTQVGSARTDAGAPTGAVRSWRHEWRQRGAAVAIVVLAVAFAVEQIITKPDLGDVSIYRHGARAAFAAGDVYDFDRHGHGFTYPPFAALVMGVLAWLPTAAMWGVMIGLGAVSLVVVLRLVAPGAVRAVLRGDRAAAVGLALLVASQPVTLTLRIGQVNLVLAAMVLADLLVLRRGVLIGLATSLKLTPGLFVVYLLARRRWAEAAGAVATIVASIGLGAVVLPGPSREYWTHRVIAGSGIGGFTTTGNQSIRGLAERVFGTSVGAVVWLLLAVPVVVLGLRLAVRAARLQLDVLAAGIVGVTACLVSPLSWPHHWVWALPALAGLWGIRGAAHRLDRWLVGTAGLLVVFSLLAVYAVGLSYVLIAVALGVRTASALRTLETRALDRPPAQTVAGTPTKRSSFTP